MTQAQVDPDSDLFEDDPELSDEPGAKTLEITTRKPDKKPEPKGVKIDDIFYEYSDANEWSLNQRNAFTQQYERVRKLEAVKEPNDRHEEAYNRATVKLLQMMVPELPTEAIEYMNIGTRTTLVMDFFIKAAQTSRFFETMKGFFGGNS